MIERVERRHRRRLDQRRDAAENVPTTKTGSSSSHFAFQADSDGLADAEGRALRHSARCPRGRPAAPSRPSIRRPGSSPPMNRVIDRRALRDDAVQHQRQREREEQAERSGRGEQADRESLAIAIRDQRRQQQAAEHEDRHARTAREQREERAERRGRDRRAARRPAEPRAEDIAAAARTTCPRPAGIRRA